VPMEVSGVIQLDVANLYQRLHRVGASSMRLIMSSLLS
jgi:hypothetical protein